MQQGHNQEAHADVNHLPVEIVPINERVRSWQAYNAGVAGQFELALVLLCHERVALSAPQDERCPSTGQIVGMQHWTGTTPSYLQGTPLYECGHTGWQTT